MPPSQAPAMTPTPSSSVVSGTTAIAGSASQRAISAALPPSGTWASSRTPRAESAACMAAGQVAPPLEPKS